MMPLIRLVTLAIRLAKLARTRQLPKPNKKFEADCPDCNEHPLYVPVYDKCYSCGRNIERKPA